MIILVATVVGLLVAALLGGSPGALGRVKLRAVWLLVLAFVAQVVVISVVPDGPRPLLETVHVLTYVGAGLVVWWNRAVPGLLLAGAGGALNAVTIALNGGTLPASERALRGAGLPVHEQEFLNSGVLADPVLPWLGDVFWVPAGVPLANVFSVGDVVLVAGVTYGAYRICRRPEAGTGWRGTAARERRAPAGAVPGPWSGWTRHERNDSPVGSSGPAPSPGAGP